MHRTFAGLFLTLSALALPGVAQTLEGAIDMHTHSSPDGTPRKVDSIELAKLAKSKGMRALVLKNHYEPTASLDPARRVELAHVLRELVRRGRTLVVATHDEDFVADVATEVIRLDRGRVSGEAVAR